MERVRFHFDFISPYSYLALAAAESFTKRHEVDWETRPVLLAALLDASGLTGPAETPVKREYTARDIMRCAESAEVPLVGPPAHPFNPLAALRTVCAYQDDPRATELAYALARACWGFGHDLSDPDGVSELTRQAGFDPIDVSKPAIKQALKDNTREAIEAGVFGVPTFIWRDELFWGHDRMPALAARLSGRLSNPEARAADWVARPRGAERPSSPWPRS